jgi:hypothetical protein
MIFGARQAPRAPVSASVTAIFSQSEEMLIAETIDAGNSRHYRAAPVVLPTTSCTPRAARATA